MQVVAHGLAGRGAEVSGVEQVEDVGDVQAVRGADLGPERVGGEHRPVGRPARLHLGLREAVGGDDVDRVAEEPGAQLGQAGARVAGAVGGQESGGLTDPGPADVG